MVLLTRVGSDYRLKINKATQTDVASVVFLTGFSGRAGMGLAGADDFEIKVSGDGADFRQAFFVDAQTGVVRFPSGVAGITPTQFGKGDISTTDDMP